MFGYGYYRKEEETDNERYLEGELERHRQAEERRSAEEERQRNARRQEVQEQFLWDERHASSWPEALRKQQVLFRREANPWIADEFPDEYFCPGANACARIIPLNSTRGFKSWTPGIRSTISAASCGGRSATTCGMPLCYVSCTLQST